VVAAASWKESIQFAGSRQHLAQAKQRRRRWWPKKSGEREPASSEGQASFLEVAGHSQRLASV